MLHDLQFLKKAGFNLVRKHAKVWPLRTRVLLDNYVGQSGSDAELFG
jgi:hypothetical protein